MTMSMTRAQYTRRSKPLRIWPAYGAKVGLAKRVDYKGTNYTVVAFTS